ncbi:MAG: response regulator, partial [Candidatus Aminicenantaceae bacterium]
MTKAKILYIEDNDTQRRTLASGLRTKGYSVSVATSGRTGLRLFNSKAFDVILCDLNMPEMDGLGVLGNIRRKDLDIPFIILSSHGSIPM